MARSKTGMKVTFSIPEELLKVADDQAALMGLERYDVIRLAITQGLVVLRMQYELTTDIDTYKDALKDLVLGVDDQAAERVGAKLEASLDRQYEAKKKTAVQEKKDR